MARRGGPCSHFDGKDFVLDIVIGLGTGYASVQEAHRVLPHSL